MKCIKVSYDSKSDSIKNNKKIKSVVKHASLGKVKVKTEGNSYLVEKKKGSDFFDVTVIKHKQKSYTERNIKILQQLSSILNVDNNSDCYRDASYNTQFFLFSRHKYTEITKMNVSLNKNITKLNEIEYKLKYNRMYKPSIELDIEYNNLIYERSSIKEQINNIKGEIYIRGLHIQIIKELYINNIKYLPEDSHELHQAAYDLACYQCNIQGQDIVEQDIVTLSEYIIALAGKENPTIVLPGRSLIACAAYIKHHYPQVNVITMPLSKVNTLKTITLQNITTKIDEHLDKYLDTTEQQGNLLVVDYIDSGNSLKETVALISARSYVNKVTSVGVYSCFSSFLKNTELTTTEQNQLAQRLPFDYTIPVMSYEEYSPLSIALHYSAFDGLAPFGKYSLKSIVQGDPEPTRSTDGFNLLVEIM